MHCLIHFTNFISLTPIKHFLLGVDVVASLPGLAGIAHPSDVLDMPVDPNEPTYCLCHQVSYGEMIGCDNPDVSLQKIVMLMEIFIYYLFSSVQSNGSISLVSA